MLSGLASMIIGAGLYDIKEAKLKHNFLLHPYTNQNKLRHKILIIIYVGKNTNTVLNCLQSIYKSSYHNYEVIVVDDTHNSSTIIKSEVKTFELKYKNIKLFRRRKITSRSNSIKAAIIKNNKNDLIMVINPDSILHKNALRNINRHFLAKQLKVLFPNEQIIFAFSLVSVYQSVNQLLKHSIKKLLSLIKSANLFEESCVVFRRSSKSKHHSSRLDLVKYGADVNIRIIPSKSWASLLLSFYGHQKNKNIKIKLFTELENIIKKDKFRDNQVYKLLLAIPINILLTCLFMTPLLITYMLYLATYFKLPIYYGVGWAIFSVLLLCLIIINNNIRSTEKLHLLLLVPLVYPIYYLIHTLRLILVLLLRATPRISNS